MKIIKLTNEQYDILVGGGIVTVDGVDYTYDVEGVKNGEVIYECDQNTTWSQVLNKLDVAIYDNSAAQKVVQDVTDRIFEGLINGEIQPGGNWIIPEGTKVITENDTYDVTDKAEVVVNCDVRTEEDEKNAEIASAWNDFFKGETGQFNLGSIKSFAGKVPLVDAHNATSFRYAFENGQATEYAVNIGDKATSTQLMFDNCPNLLRVDLIGSTRNVTTFEDMFYRSPKLEEINGVFDLTSATNTNWMFGGDTPLREVRFEPYSIHIPIYGLSRNRQLSADSVISVLNGLADLSWLASKTQEFSGALTYDTTDDNVKQAIANAVAKNWVIKFGGRTHTGE